MNSEKRRKRLAVEQRKKLDAAQNKKKLGVARKNEQNSRGSRRSVESRNFENKSDENKSAETRRDEPKRLLRVSGRLKLRKGHRPKRLKGWRICRESKPSSSECKWRSKEDKERRPRGRGAKRLKG